MPNATPQPTRPAPRAGAQSIERALSLVNLVALHHDTGVALSALVKASGLDRTTAWRMLQRLTLSGLLERDERHGHYRLGSQATAWGAASLSQAALIRDCEPVMKTLARRTGDNVFLVLRLGDYSHCLHLEQGDHAVPSFRQTVGETRLLGLGVASIAMLAALSDEQIVAHHTRHQLTYDLEGVSRAQLLRWVLTTRERGFAYRSTAGIAAAGLHWRLGGNAIAALSVGASRVRLPLSRAADVARLMASHWPPVVA